MKFCSQCGESVSLQIPKGDNRERFVCASCNTIHYQNPNTVVGTIPIWHDTNGEPKVLLCKRAIEPRVGYWTVPAGFLENGETCKEGAIRETDEESCAKINDVFLYRIFSTIDRLQVHMYFRATMTSPNFSVTQESAEVGLFSFDEIPWRDIAFPSVYRALSDFVNDYTAKIYNIEMSNIVREDWKKLNT